MLISSAIRANRKTITVYLLNYCCVRRAWQKLENSAVWFASARVHTLSDIVVFTGSLDVLYWGKVSAAGRKPLSGSLSHGKTDTLVTPICAGWSRNHRGWNHISWKPPRLGKGKTNLSGSFHGWECLPWEILWKTSVRIVKSYKTKVEVLLRLTVSVSLGVETLLGLMTRI